jgi:hypothetical protein
LLVSCITVLLFRIYQDSKRIEKLEKELVETLDKLFDEHQDAIRWEERWRKMSHATSFWRGLFERCRCIKCEKINENLRKLNDKGSNQRKN